MVDWLYIDFNSFFASCEQQENPELRGRPVAVVPMLADSTSCIAASYEAKAYGVKTGTKVGDARKMCPGIVFVPAHHSHYVKYHHAALVSIEKCIPIHSVCSIDEICCELTGSQKNLEKAQRLVETIKATLREDLGGSLTVSIGLGPNILLAKMAADMKKPDGMTSIELQELPQKLHQLKLRDIPGIGQKMEYRLNQKNIFTMEQFLKLSEQQMRAIWGSLVGARYYRLLKGESIQVLRGSQKSISHEHVLPPKERNFRDTYVVLQKLINKAALRLRRSKWMAKRMMVSIRYLNQTKWKEEFILHETQDTGLLIKKMTEGLRRCPKEARPLKVGITLYDFVPESEHQLSFFENDKKNKFFKAVDAINEKYGKDTVHLASLHNHLGSAPTRIAFSRIPELDELDETAEV